MRITAKGQVTIPQAVRNKLGLLPNTEVEFIVEGNAVRLRKVTSRTGGRGKRALARLRGKASVSMTTDQIMALTRAEK
jgi:antitoxin PrlF